MSRRTFLRTFGAGTAALVPFACGKLHRQSYNHHSIPNGTKDFSAAYGIVSPLITPFRDDRAIDWDTYDRLVEWHVEKGVDGLFAVCGSSEYFSLTEDEAVELADRAVKRGGDRTHVLAGSTLHDDLTQNIAMTRRMWEQTGLDGCFVTTPRGGFEDGPIIEYFVALHDAVNIPLFGYEMPSASLYKFSPSALAELGQKERFIGLKDTSTRAELGRPRAIETVREKLDAVRGTLKIMQANTEFLLDALDIGCTGGINTTANVAPGLLAKVYRLWKKGDVDAARQLHERILAIDRIMREGYVRSAKVGLAMMGFPITPYCRQELPEITSDDVARLREMVRLIRRAEEEFEVT